MFIDKATEFMPGSDVVTKWPNYCQGPTLCFNSDGDHVLCSTMISAMDVKLQAPFIINSCSGQSTPPTAASPSAMENLLASIDIDDSTAVALLGYYSSTCPAALTPPTAALASAMENACASDADSQDIRCCCNDKDEN